MKRILKVQHPMLHLYTLKLIKMQVPFCGRKWRQCVFGIQERVVSLMYWL